MVAVYFYKIILVIKDKREKYVRFIESPNKEKHVKKFGIQHY